MALKTEQSRTQAQQTEQPPETLLQLLHRYNVYTPIFQHLQTEWMPDFARRNGHEPTPADVLRATRDYIAELIRTNHTTQIGVSREQAESLLAEINRFPAPQTARSMRDERPGVQFEMSIIFRGHGLADHMREATAVWMQRRREEIDPNWRPADGELMGFVIRHLSELSQRQEPGIPGVSSHDVSIALRELSALWNERFPPSRERVRDAASRIEEIRLGILRQAGIGERFLQSERAWEQEWQQRFHSLPTAEQRLGWTIAQLETARNYNQGALFGTTNQAIDDAVDRLTNLRDTINVSRRRPSDRFD